MSREEAQDGELGSPQNYGIKLPGSSEICCAIWRIFQRVAACSAVPKLTYLPFTNSL